MKFLILAIVSFVILDVGASEFWLHRAHEYTSSGFSYKQECREMNSSEFYDYFDFTILENKKWSGLELDAFYRDDINQLVIYHGNDHSDGQRQYQCFGEKYVTLSLFLKEINKFNKKLKVWIDLKNDNWQGLRAASHVAGTMHGDIDFFVETKSLLGIYWLNSNQIKSSYWGKYRGDSELSKLQNKMKLWIIETFFTPNKYSLPCDKLIQREYLFKNKRVSCWNTRRKTLNIIKKLKPFNKLEVILEGLE